MPESALAEAAPADAETEELRTTLRAAGYPVRSRRGRPSWFHEGPALPLMARLRGAKPRRAEPPAASAHARVGLEEPEPALEVTLQELRRLLEALSPEDRERVLDLARRLRAK